MIGRPVNSHASSPATTAGDQRRAVRPAGLGTAAGAVPEPAEPAVQRGRRSDRLAGADEADHHRGGGAEPQHDAGEREKIEVHQRRTPVIRSERVDQAP